VASTFLIALREGLEAALIVGILVAYLKKSNRKRALALLWTGVGLAISVSLIFGAFLSFTSKELSPRGEMVFAGTTSIVATALVTFMVFWMKRAARTIKGDLENKVDQALPLGGAALMGAAFFSVVREGLETALFIFSNFKTVSKDFGPTIGLVLGLSAAVFLGVAIYKRAIRINLSKFFLLTGSALLIVAGGVLAHGVKEFQEFGVLPGAHAFAWNWNNPNNLIESFLSGTVGISTTTTYLQLFIWVLYLALVLPFFFAPVTRKELATVPSN
jgi:high-affinity iron transporter